MPSWTLSQAPSLVGKRVLITGGNSGLGFETARMIAGLGGELVLACRNAVKAKHAIEALQQEYPLIHISLVMLDLAQLSSVHEAANVLNAAGKPIDLLINNAGVLAGPFQLTKDGFERQIGTNHFGHFAFTSLLFPLLAKSNAPRVVTISSLAHKFAHLKVEDLYGEQRPNHYIPRWAYYRSKLANILFAYELARQSEAHHAPLLSVATHPGIAQTNLFAQQNEQAGMPWYYRLLPMHSAAEGALSIVRAAVDEAAQNGDYFGPSGWFGIRGNPIKSASSLRSHDLNLAQQLWACSEQLTGCKMDWTVFSKESSQ